MPVVGYALDKFSLYWPDNKAAYARWGNAWPLLHGYSFRTAVFEGGLNRGALDQLQRGGFEASPGTRFSPSDYDLVVDRHSAYEDCAYMKVENDDNNDMCKSRIETMVAVLEKSPNAYLALSYDPEERKKDMTALRSEWELLKKHV